MKSLPSIPSFLLMMTLLLSLGLMLPVRAEDSSNTFTTSGFDNASGLSSPVVHADGSISFALHAPGAREVTVALGEAVITRVNLERNTAGWWTGRVGPLMPGLHGYVFLVDGTAMIDPLNPRVKLGTVIYSSIAEVAGAQPRFDAIQAVPQGVEHVVRYHSSSQQRLQTLHVYLPAAYAMEPRRQFPVLYLRHGGGDAAHSWLQDGRAGVILDNLIAHGAAEPMIIVTTNGLTDGTWSHSSSPAGMKLLETELLQDVIPLIERSYRTETGPGARAIAGLSMGGGQAFVIGLRQTDTFGWIAQFGSGLLADKDLDLATLCPELRDASTVNARLRLLWIGCGTADPRFPGHVALMDELRLLGVRAEFHQSEGGHEWSVWREQLHALLPVLFRPPVAMGR